MDGFSTKDNKQSNYKFTLNFRTIYLLVCFSGLIALICTACGSLPSRKKEVHAQYSHTELQPGKHYLAYHGEESMTIEIATEKWLAKAEKLCDSREFEYEFNAQEMRGKDYSDAKHPYIEGDLFCSTGE